MKLPVRSKATLVLMSFSPTQLLAVLMASLKASAVPLMGPVYTRLSFSATATALTPSVSPLGNPLMLVLLRYPVFHCAFPSKWMAHANTGLEALPVYTSSWSPIVDRESVDGKSAMWRTVPAGTSATAVYDMVLSVLSLARKPEPVSPPPHQQHIELALNSAVS